MVKRSAATAVCLLALALALAGHAAVPSPREHLGFTPGDDYKLADYSQVTGYFQKLVKASDRIRLVEFGKSAEGKAMYVAFLSSPENLRRLDHWRGISRRLALGQATKEEAQRLAAEGRALVWIDSGLHASEVAPVQHSFDLAYRMVAGEDEETRRIREKVILMQVPVINPDGLDWIVHWYRGNTGSPHELAPLPRLYHKYAGHDNNRDWFMLNLPESRHVTRLLFREWFPQIVYNQHQAPPFPARIFVPPYAEPLNPHIPAAVMEGINLIGSAMKERFAREDRPGVLSYHGYDAWWNGGLRSVPAFHNMHGILTETALYSYGTPGAYKKSDLPERFENGMPAQEPSVFYERPWLGGRWGVRDAIDYMLTADFAILELAAARSQHFLYKSWEMARAAIGNGSEIKPYAYVVPKEQWDESAAVDMLRRLQWSGVEVMRASAQFRIGSNEYDAGAWVILAGQPFRAYVMDLLEPQRYPEIQSGSGGPTKRPYDVAGWTMPLNMGVRVVRADDRFSASLEAAGELPAPEPSFDHRQNSAFVGVAARLASGGTVLRSAGGEFVTATNEAAGAGWELAVPRVGLYVPNTANMDTGWTQFLLESYKVPFRELSGADVRRQGLRERFDSIILASQTASSILHGARIGEPTGRSRPGEPVQVQRPEFTGGIGIEGLLRLDEFVRGGGTLIAFDDAAELPIQFFPLPLRSVARGGEGRDAYYCPGSILRVEVETKHPVAFGVPGESHVFTSGGHAWEITLADGWKQGEREVRSVARYAKSNVLASGWLSGEKTIAGKHVLVEARHGAGRVILFGFRPQFRAQTAGTFKYILNAIYHASAKELTRVPSARR